MEGITICVLLCGSCNARLLCLMLIFKNSNTSYPIEDLPDAADGVTYRATPSASINNVAIQKWFRDVRYCVSGGPFISERTLL